MQSVRLRGCEGDWLLEELVDYALLHNSLLMHKGFPTEVIAQVRSPDPRDTAPPSTQPLPEPVLPAPLPPPEELLPAPVPPTAPQTPSEPLPETITVRRFVVTGSTVFRQAEFDRVTAPYTQRPITVSELFAARAAVTQLYVDRGYITSGAFIPPQRLQNGIVEIRVIEGKLEEIQITGLRRLNPNYVRSRLAIATRPPLNRSRLLEALQLLQLNPLIQTISAELTAGTRPGESLLQVNVTEGRTFDAQLLFDNGRSPSVGTDRRQIQLSQANVTGLGDSLSFGYTNTNGSHVFDVDYSLPFNPRNGTLSLSFQTAKSSVIEEPFTPLDIESASRYFEATVRQPISQSPTHEIALGSTLTLRYSKSRLFGGDLPFPALGADSNGVTRLSALRFFQDALWRSPRSVIALRSQFSIGLNAFNATINADAPDSRFFAWRGQAQWVRLLAPDTLLLVRGDMQVADRPLLPFEQFAIGGIDSVRGYRQDLLLTDNGVFASAELRLPIARIPKWNGVLQVTPFAEIGHGWNRGNSNGLKTDTLASVGLGLRLQLSEWLTARFDWGIPLVKVPRQNNTLQERGLYFSIVVSPF